MLWHVLGLHEKEWGVYKIYHFFTYVYYEAMNFSVLRRSLAIAYPYPSHTRQAVSAILVLMPHTDRYPGLAEMPLKCSV